MNRTRPLAALAFAALLLAACSSSSSTSTASTAPSTSASTSSSVAATDATAYADGVCTSISDWQQSLTDGGQQFQDAVSGGTPTPQDVKDALESYLSSAVEDTQTMIDEIEALGPPPGAEETRTAIVSALTDVQTLFEGVRSSVQSLDTTNPASMATAMTDLVPQLQQGAQDVSDSLAAIPEGELKTAIENNPSCQG
jgi:hypothetical protein